MRDSHSTAVPTTARRAPAQPRWRHACCRWCRDHDVGQGQAAGSRRRSGRPVRQWPASVPRRDRASWTRRHQPDTRYGADVDVLDPVERLFTFSGPFTHQRSAVRYRPRPPRLLQVSGERDTAMAADFVRRVALHRRWSETEADDAGTPVALNMTCCAVCGRCVRVAENDSIPTQFRCCRMSTRRR